MQSYAGYFFIFAAASSWGFLGILGRVAMDAGVAPIDVAFWRALIGGGFLFMHAACIKQAKIHNRNDFISFCLFGIFSIATFFTVYQYAIKEGGAALASVLLYTAPAWVAVFSRIFFGLRFTTITAIAIAMSLIGCIFISFSQANISSELIQGQGVSILGIVFGLLSGFLYATHYAVTKKLLITYSPFTIYGYASLVAALCIFPFTNLSFNYSLAVWASIIGLGFLSTYIGYWTYCEAIKRLHPTKAAVLATIEPVVATGAAWYFWGENFTTLGWIGAILIVSTVIVFLFDERKPNV